MTEVTPLFNYISQKVCPDNLHRQFSSHRYVITSQGTDNFPRIDMLLASHIPKNAIYSLSNVIYQTTGYFTTPKDVEWMTVDKFWNIFPDPFGMQF